jgi:hypothetical protein
VSIAGIQRNPIQIASRQLMNAMIKLVVSRRSSGANNAAMDPRDCGCAAR